MARLKLDDAVLDQLVNNNWLDFSPAQRKMVSALKSGQNQYVVGGNPDELRIAITATLVHKLKASFEDVARALILVPSPEIADAYAALFEVLGNHTDLRVWTAYEGPKIQQQKENIYFGADVVIATPQRLNDLLNIEGFNSASVQTFILDSADQLLKVGTTGYTQRISDSIPLKQRIAFAPEPKGAIGSFMSRYAFPYTKITLEL
jgi:superfamily II DNA/RNA helicase